MNDIETLEKEIALLKEKIGLMVKARELEKDLDELREKGKQYIPVPYPCPVYPVYPENPSRPWTGTPYKPIITWITGGTTAYIHGYETKTR